MQKHAATAELGVTLKRILLGGLALIVRPQYVVQLVEGGTCWLGSSYV